MVDQVCQQSQFGTHAVLLMPLMGHEKLPRGFTASQKAICKSRPDYLISSLWCLWIVHECGIHQRAENGFQYL